MRDTGLPGPLGPCRSGSPYVVLERHGSIRSLVPAGPPRVLRTALARSNGPDPVLRHVARSCYARLVATERLPAAVAGHVPRRVVRIDDRGLRELVEAHVGTAAALAFHLGPPRANRKPVVHVLDDEGRLVAVAKVAVDDLTASLVSHEADALAALSSLDGDPHLAVPRLIALEDWAGRPLLLQSAIRLEHRHRVPSPERRSAAERAVVAAVRRDREGDRFLRSLRERVRSLPVPHQRELLVRAVDTAGDRLDVPSVGTGAWHGDWSPQNVAATAAGVAAWDWERFATDRPLGFDACHFGLQRLLARRRTQPGVNVLTRAPGTFGCWQSLAHPDQAQALALLLLVDLAARYVGDHQAATGSPGAGVLAWLEQALERFDRRTVPVERSHR